MTARDIAPDRLLGFGVVGPDGLYGIVDHATLDVDEGVMVVRRGWWIFSRRYLLRSDVVRRVDAECRAVSVNARRHELVPMPNEHPPRPRRPATAPGDPVFSTEDLRIMGHSRPPV